MTSFDAAVVKEQGVTFTVVKVRSGIIGRSGEPDTRSFLSQAFGTPVVLMEQDSRGRPRYSGRRDLVDFCASILMQQLPWRRCSIS